MAQISYGTITITDTTDLEFTIEYTRNQSTSTPPAQSSSDWNTTRPAWAQGYYIWQRTRIHKYGTAESEDTFSTAICVSGSTGGTGQSLTATKTQYTHVASNVTITTQNHTSYTWTDNVPEYDSTKPVYWGRITNTYINPAKTEYIVYKDNGITESIGKAVAAEANAATALSISQHANEDSQGAMAQAASNVSEIKRIWYAQSAATPTPVAPTTGITTTAAHDAWSITKPAPNNDYQYYFYCDQTKTGGGVYSWSEVILDTSNLSQYQIGALTSKVKNFWWDSSGAHVASGKNGNEVTTNTISTYGYHALMGLTGINFNYDSAKVVDLNSTTPSLDFYQPPTISGSTVIQGKKTMMLSANALKFYNPTNGTTEQAVLDSNGLLLKEGGVKSGSVNAGNSGFVYLSTKNYGSNLTINGHQASNWREVIGTKFGVDADGNLYASNADISGKIVASDGEIGGFVIDSSSIHTKNVAITSNADNSVGLSSSTFTRTINGTSRSNLKFAIGSKFGVASDGTLYSSGLDSVASRVDDIEDWEIGGRNLLWYTSLPNIMSNKWYQNGTAVRSVEDEKLTITGAGEVLPYSDWWRPYAIPSGTEVTLSCYFYENTVSDGNRNIYYSSEPWQYKKVPPNFTGKWVETFKTTVDITKLCPEYDLRNSTGGKWVVGPIKLELGNKATDWTPAPEDVDVSISSLETKITQNAEAIVLEASRREMATNMLLDSDVPSLTKVNALYDRYWSNKEEASWCTPSIVELSDPPDQGIKYACRFVATASGHSDNNIGRAIVFYNSEYTSKSLPLHVGTKYTVSYWARCTSGQGRAWVWYTYKKNGSGYDGRDAIPITDLTSTWKQYVGTIELESEPPWNRLWFYAYFPANTAGTVEICGMNLVAGDNVEAYSTTIEQTADNVLIKATRSGASAADKTAGGTSAIGLINVSPDNVKIEAKNVDITGTTTFSDGTSIQSRIDAVEIGGRNLLRDSNIDNGIAVNMVGGTFLSYGEWHRESRCVVEYVSNGDYLKITSGNSDAPASRYGVYQDIVIEPNTDYVLSLEKTTKCYVGYQFTGTTEAVMWPDDNGNWTVVNGRWSKVIRTNESTHNRCRIYCYATYSSGESRLQRIKFEKGNKATDWTPAPEDSYKPSIHSINASGTDASHTYSSLIGWMARTDELSWNVESTSGIKVGDTVRIGIIASDMGTNGTKVYFVATVTRIDTATLLHAISKGLDTTVIDGGHILTGQIDANRMNANVINAVNNGTGKINADKINASQINIGDLAGEIGGRNLIRRSLNLADFIQESANCPTTVYPDYLSIKHTIDNTSIYGAYYDIPLSALEAGAKYTLSFNAISPPTSAKFSVGDSINAWAGVTGYQTAVAGHNEITFTAPSGVKWIRIYLSVNAYNAEFKVSHIKLEKGVVATDWTPASEDLESRQKINVKDILLENAQHTSITVSGESITFKRISDSTGGWGAYYDFPCEPNSYYTVSAKVEGGDAGEQDKWKITFGTATVIESSVSIWGGLGRTCNYAGIGGYYIATNNIKTYAAQKYIRLYFYSTTPNATWTLSDITIQKGAELGNTAQYITHVNNNGIIIHPASGTSNRVEIDGGAVRVYKGGSLRATFSDEVHIQTANGTYPKVGINASSAWLSSAATTYADMRTDGLNIVKDNVSVAFYGDDARIGRSDKSRVYITADNGMRVYDKNNKRRLWLDWEGFFIYDDSESNMSAFTPSYIRIGKDTSGHASIKSDGLHVWTGADSTASNEVAFFGASARIGKTGTNKRNVYITDEAVQIRNNTTVLAEYGATIKLNNPSGTTVATINADGINMTAGSIALGTTFSVTKAGALSATSGSIGGWSISGSELYASSGSTYTRINPSIFESKTYDSHSDLYTQIKDGGVTMRAGAKDTTSPTLTTIYGPAYDYSTSTASGSVACYKEWSLMRGAGGTLVHRFCGNDGYKDNAAFWYGLPVYMKSSLKVAGTKSREAETEDYGNRLLYSYEMPSPMFGDVGEGRIGEDGITYITIDPIFSETINLSQYQIFLQKYGSGEIYVLERNFSYFVVKGTPGLFFGWELKAKQKGFEQQRLDKDATFGEPQEAYGDYGFWHLQDIKESRGL